MVDEIVVTNTREVSWDCSCGTTNQCSIEAHPLIGDEKKCASCGKEYLIHVIPELEEL